MKDVIAALFEYGLWANGRLLAKAASLAEPALHQRFTRGAEPILPTFVHPVSADWRWFARWRGETLPPMLSVTDLPTLDAVREKWEALHPLRRAYIASLSDADLREVIRWSRDGGTAALPRWQGIVQCANHGTQHRSEIAAMLTDAGHSPGDLDFGRYCLERAAS